MPQKPPKTPQNAPKGPLVQTGGPLGPFLAIFGPFLGIFIGLLGPRGRAPQSHSFRRYAGAPQLLVPRRFLHKIGEFFMESLHY
jgi:hypothetical protein